MTRVVRIAARRAPVYENLVSEKVIYPIFELSGPPCENEGCSGVLVNHVTTKKPSECFRKCSVCGTEFDRVPTTEMLAHFERTVGRILKGEGTN